MAIPKQWKNHITNPQNKTNLVAFLTSAWVEMGQERLADGQQLVTGEGFPDTNQAVIINRGSFSITPLLVSDHEEADTRILLHALHPSCVIKSPDSDVAII